MQKQIPNSQERNSKAARLREASTRLQALPLDRLPTTAEWDEATSELTVDDLEHLKKLAAGYRDRCLEDAGSEVGDERVEEATSAVLLHPKDPDWAREILTAVQAASWKGPQVEAFVAALKKRTGKGRTKGVSAVWIVPLAGALVGVPLLVGAVLLFGLGWNRSAAQSPVQGPRDLQAVFDTQGVKANIQVAQSRMLLFPDATVAEVSAWVTFPEHTVEVWEGSVNVLDAQGSILTQREVTFHAANDGPLKAGQGVSVFEQFDAYPFFDRVTSFQITTSRILAKEAHPKNLRELAVQGTADFPSGYKLRVWVTEERWEDRFASKVHTFALDIENAGLKPFTVLEFDLLWRDTQGKLLKTLTLRPVSAFRTPFPSGSRLPWTQQTVFDTEVFSWQPGAEPIPVLQLRAWK